MRKLLFVLLTLASLMMPTLAHAQDIQKPGHRAVTHPSLVVQTSGQAPCIYAVAPDSGPTSGGTQITIVGCHFGPNSAVIIGGFPASNVSAAVCNSSSKDCSVLYATTPPHYYPGTTSLIVLAHGQGAYTTFTYF